jgi:F420-dependent oxidoreductase-like protein
MRFGAFVPQGWKLDLGEIPVEHQWDTMVSAARVAEDVGYESVWVYDHLHTFPVVTQQSTWEAWTVMAGLAEATETIRLGQMCTCNGYRPPAMLAKVTANIDVMSHGRLEVGIGAGWYEHEYDGYGYPFPRPAVRIGELDEAVQILRLMWTEDEAYFEGKHYRLDGAINRPRPLQDPYPPLWIAGGGEQLTLRVVAKYGDYANYGGDAETFRHKTEVLQDHCRDVGRDFDEITLSRSFECLIAEDESALQDKLAEVERLLPEGRTMEEWSRIPIVGTPEQVAAQIAEYRGLGIDYVMAYFHDAAWGDGMRLFANEVMPAFV